MLVQEAADGRIKAVTGMDREGNLQTADPSQQNVSNLLNVNTQEAALETFFKKFMQEAENPTHTGIFIMAERALDNLIRLDFDPQTLEQYRVKPAAESRTQVAVNSEGKTVEAVKNVKEPLKQGQEQPTPAQTRHAKNTPPKA